MTISNYHRRTALCLLFVFVYPLVFPIISYALTTGPTTPEVSTFQPSGVTDMVDPFTGGFQHNIPLMQVGDYPINLSYTSGHSPDEEASMVGLGWNLNVGVINRTVRGMADDFNGEDIKTEFYVKPNRTYGTKAGFGFELIGFPASVGHTYGLSWNNYNGLNVESHVDFSLMAGDKAKLLKNSSLGFSMSSDDGVGVHLSVSFSSKLAKESKQNRLNIGVGYNSREGVQNLSLSAGHYRQNARKGGTSLSIPFGTTTYLPASEMEFENLSFGTSFKAGVEAWGVNPELDFSGYFSQQKLRANEKTTHAYGYLYLQNSDVERDDALDFNREKDGSFSENTPVLPLTALMHDFYSVNAQGLSGTFRPFRNETGYVFEENSNHPSYSGNLAVEYAAANTAKLGVELDVNSSTSKSGAWSDNNAAAPQLPFSKFTEGSLQEPVYFRQLGELSVSANPNFFNEMGNTRAVRVATNGQETLAKLESNDGFTQALNGQRRESREPRNTNFSYLTVGMLKKLKPYRTATVSPSAKDHHIGEITVIKEDGTRYVFAQAAYNIQQREVTFAVGNNRKGLNQLLPNGQNLVTYTPNTHDLAGSNPCGLDEYVQAVNTPAYAYAYHLTEVLSSDYVDVTNDGVTPDDLGNYTKFTYQSNTSGNTSGNTPIQWRTPLGTNTAIYTEGLKTIETDDRAHYVFGEKEVFCVKSIETRTQIAQFEYQIRQDALGVQNKDGAINSAIALQSLKSISLYALKDFQSNGANAELIKKANFEYNYSLCPNVPNNLTGARGKLTLEKLYFTYQKSLKGKHTPYIFDYYNNTAINYGTQIADRWGTYKPNDLAKPNNEFSYAEQDSTKAAQQASLWNLKGITLPTNGKISVEYEADDYQFVQNVKAGEMFEVIGAGDNPTSLPTDKGNLYTPTFNGLPPPPHLHDYIFVKLKKPIPANTPSNDVYFREHYLAALKDNLMYFRFRVNVNKSINNTLPRYENVSGYAEIDVSNSGAVNNTEGYIKLKPVTLKDKSGYDVNPISKAAINFSKINTPFYIYDNAPPGEGSGVWATIKELADATLIQSTLQMFREQTRLIENGYGQKFIPTASVVRLCNPDGHKMGGGERVKRIRMVDDWDNMTAANEPNAEYGQEYRYNLLDNTSSGVAAFEPMIGADENSLRQPLTVPKDERKQQRILAPDDEYYLETPVGEMFYPSPSVGYSRVTVRNLAKPNVKSHATGWTIQEFFTAKDFPIIYQETELKRSEFKTDLKRWKLKNPLFHRLTVTQGFAIETNDMHGKMKSQTVFDEGGNRISGMVYHYKSVAGRDGIQHLTNTADVVTKQNRVNSALIGVDCDVVADFREQSTHSQSVGVQGNVDGFIIGVIPIIVPSGYPEVTSEKTRFRSATVTKVLYRTGILEEVVAYDLGSQIATKNLLFDAETGEVLLTQTVNEYDDPVYNFTYPAHWAYDGMSQAAKNLGYSNSNCFTKVNNAYYLTDGNFQYGDELLIFDNNTPVLTTRFWVIPVAGVSSLKIVTDSGVNPTFSSNALRFMIVRSGRRNQPTAPVGSVTSLSNPILINTSGRRYLQFGATTQIINAQVQEFKDRWQPYCCDALPDTEGVVTPTANPYLLGANGNWRPLKSWAFLTQRLPNNLNQVDGRKGGIYANFSPFWVPTGGSLFRNPTNWTWTAEALRYNKLGAEVENKDALGRFSSALFGYQHTLPIGVAANAPQRQIGFDGFEDEITKCETGLTFRFQRIFRSNSEAHTGLYSLKLMPTKSVLIQALDSLCELTPPPANPTPTPVNPTHNNLISNNNVPQPLDFCKSCTPQYSPLSGTQSDTFVLNFWIKVPQSNDFIYQGLTTKAEITVLNTTTTLNLGTPKRTKRIEDWQQVEYTFTTPQMTTANVGFKLTLTNSRIDNLPIFIDDIRIQPFKSSLKTYVYNAQTLRYMAELDERNFATFYEYDPEGQLVRVKKETERGIVTLKDVKNHISQK